MPKFGLGVLQGELLEGNVCETTLGRVSYMGRYPPRLSECEVPCQV
jgi:hypothetical protein